MKWKIRKVSRHIPREVMIRVVRRDNSACQACGRHLLDNEIQFDHIIPISKGGPSNESNLRTICSDCNIMKSDNAEFI
jgi:5-methylcytosine-specific restriction endonuclease McrA